MAGFERTELAVKLETAYNEAQSVYWMKVAIPLVEKWKREGQKEESRPDVSWLLDQCHIYAWEQVAKEFQAQG